MLGGRLVRRIALRRAVAALVDGKEKIPAEELKRLEAIIKQAKNR